MSLLRSSRVYTPHLILTLAMMAVMVSGARAEGPDPASLQKPSSGNGSVRLTSTIVKFAPMQPATETGPSLVKPAAAPKKLSAAEQAAMRTFERARGAFTGFCKDWEAKLSQRERDNLAAIRWKLQNGWKVGQYLGYGKIRSCTCKRSPRGQPVGELTYGEMNNYLTGKTIDEAKHAAPKSTLATETTEIFGWGKKGWEY
jgi:hypothetical protein